MGKMLPPPHEMDFTNISDEELVDYISRMYQATGAIPGMPERTTVNSLSSEHLNQVRQTLTEMAASGPPPGQMNSIADTSGEDLKIFAGSMFFKSLCGEK